MINYEIELIPCVSSIEPATYKFHYPNSYIAFVRLRMYVRKISWVKYGKLYKIHTNGQRSLYAVCYH